MSKYIEAIKRYEIARQLINKLDKKRNLLVTSCENDKNPFVPTNCFVLAHESMTVEQGLCEPYESVTYDEVFSNGEFNNDVSLCDKCREAYAIKKGSLANAKKEFGVAKRSLSALGKKLIKEGGL